MSEQNPKWMKHQFDDDEHRVWESVFPPLAQPSSVLGMSVRRRRPSPLYMGKIVRSLAELGVYPVFRTTASGDLVPWDTTTEPQQAWRLDPGIRSLMGNMQVGSDPNERIDAWYHPVDLANHFGADPSQWVYWPEGIAAVRPGIDRCDLVLRVDLDPSNYAYLRDRKILKRVLPKVRLVSTGGVAFFAAAAVAPWKTADDRARIGRLKTKLEVDFVVLRNEALLPVDPVVTDLDKIAESVRNGALRNSRPEHTRVPTSAPVVINPTTVAAINPPPAPMSPEEELRRIESRAAELRREIETRDTARRVDAGLRQYNATVDAFRTAISSAKVGPVDLRVPSFDPNNPDRDVSGSIRIDGVILTLPDGREYAFGSGRIIEADTSDTFDDDRASFESDPVGYTFGG